MSGGHFNYGCFSISQFADELRLEIENNNMKDEYNYAHGFNDKTIELLSTTRQIIEVAGRLAREVERLYSGDHGEENFADLASEILSGRFYNEKKN